LRGVVFAFEPPICINIYRLVGEGIKRPDLSPKLPRFTLALRVSASIAESTGSIRYIYDSVAVSSALAGGRGGSHGNSGNENGGGNGNNGGGNSNGDYGLGNGSVNSNYGLGGSNAGQRDDDNAGKPFLGGQGQLDKTSWPGKSWPDLDGEKKSWESHLKDGLNPGFDLGKGQADSNFTPKDKKEGPGRNPPLASPVTKDEQQARCFLIRHPLDTYKRYELLMLLGQLGHGIKHALQSQPALDDVTAVDSLKLRHSIKINSHTAHLGSALLIEPDVMDDSQHPTVEARAGLPLIEASESACASLLHQIVSFFWIAGQGISKPAQARRKLHDASPHIIGHERFSHTGSHNGAGGALIQPAPPCALVLIKGTIVRQLNKQDREKIQS
jgi:hypothetical protein